MTGNRYLGLNSLKMFGADWLQSSLP